MCAQVYHLNMRTLLNTLPIILITLTACNIVRVEQLPELPTATTVQSISVTEVATVDRALQRVPGTEGVANPSPEPCEFNTGQPTTQHIVDADVDYTQRTVSARQTVHYINRTGMNLSQIVMVVEPNRWPNAFMLQRVTLGDDIQPLRYELTGRRLTIDLPQTLATECTQSIELSFSINVPPITDGLQGLSGFFGASDRQLNLGHWLPVVAPYDTEGWGVREASAIGEQHVLDVADWNVTLNLTDMTNRLRLAAPGVRAQIDENTWNFIHNNARDFAVSMSDSFNRSTRETSSGVMIELFWFNNAVIETEEGEIIDGAEHTLNMTARSLEMYEDLYGDYPFHNLVVVQGDFPDGMELSGLFFVSDDWFVSYLGNPAAYLTLITIHEVAHQWWYGLVGNDAARHPWLDEAFATYSEFVFIEEHFPELKDWWWEFRVNRYSPDGFVDSSVYDFQSIRSYINTVYLHGAQMLHTLRSDLGTDPFFEWLARYAEAGQDQLATPDLLWSLLSDEQLELTQATRTNFLRNP